MSVWGYNSLESDFGLDMRDGVILDHAYELEHNLRDIGATKDLEELHIPLASAAILNAVVSKLGGACYDKTDIARWKRNSTIILDRIEREYEYSPEDISSCRRGISSILAELDRSAPKDKSGFLDAYERWSERKFGSVFPGTPPINTPGEQGSDGKADTVAS